MARIRFSCGHCRVDSETPIKGDEVFVSHDMDSAPIVWTRCPKCAYGTTRNVDQHNFDSLLHNGSEYRDPWTGEPVIQPFKEWLNQVKPEDFAHA